MTARILVFFFSLFVAWTDVIASPITHATHTFSLANTSTYEFQSRINGVRYNLYISLPKKYNDSKKHFPIIYLLDADYSFALAKQISEHLSDRNKIEESIIVGIAYAMPDEYKKNRTRDYTPSYVATGGYGAAYQKYSGGAEKFSQFLELELIPYFNQHYRVSDSTFVGHSFGGLFGAYLLVKHPSLFNNYIIVSPSLWYDNHFLLEIAKRKQHFNFNKKTSAYLIIGSKENGGDYRMVDDLKILNTLIKARPHKNFYSTLKIIDDLDHDTIFPMALTQGLMNILARSPY